MNKQLLWVVTPIGIGVLLILLFFFANSTPLASSGDLQFVDEVVGDGKEAGTGDLVSVYYTGKLKDGTVFDSNFGKEPFTFRIGDTGKRGVIKGWNKGVVGMKEGGIRNLVIPPEMGYGPRGFPPKIPPSSELYFKIQLLKVE